MRAAHFFMLLVALVLLSAVALGQTAGPFAGPYQGKRPMVAAPVMRQHLRKRVQPKYPQAARRRCLQGNVVLRVVVAADGAVKTIRVLDGDKLLAHAAVEAVRQWQYEPYRLNGKAVSVVTNVTLRFRLPRAKCGASTRAMQHVAEVSW